MSTAWPPHRADAGVGTSSEGEHASKSAAGVPISERSTAASAFADHGRFEWFAAYAVEAVGQASAKLIAWGKGIDRRLRFCRRWRVISAGGLILLALLSTKLLVPQGTKTNSELPPSGPPPGGLLRTPSPEDVRAPQYHLTREEEAMFGQYQAVGLGKESMEEAYKPAPRTYVAPPNGDIYSTFGVVMAANRSQALKMSRFFKSMAKFCLDCDRLRFLVVVPSKEVDFFNDVRSKHIDSLPGLEFVPFSHVFPALNKTLADITPDWPKGWSGWSEDRLLKDKDWPLYKSLQKVYGCLHLAREYCMVIDPNGFFIRDGMVVDIYGGFRKSPYVVYSSYFRQRYGATESAQKLLGYQENRGWALEEHNWIMETNIVAEIERILRENRPKLAEMESLVFIEDLYWIYMMHNRHRYPRLRILDTANLVGRETTEKIRKLSDYDDFGSPALWEELWWYMEKEPQLLNVAVKAFNRAGFKMFKPGKNKESITLLERARSIVLCVSEQPDNVYEMAMSGHFSRFGHGAN